MSDNTEIEHQAKLKIKYYKTKAEIITERHKKAFEYFNGLYLKVVEKNRKLKAENEKLTEIKNIYVKTCQNHEKEIARLHIIHGVKKGEKQIGQLKAELDEARRIACIWESRHEEWINGPDYLSPEQAAQQRKWNCFKE